MGTERARPAALPVLERPEHLHVTEIAIGPNRRDEQGTAEAGALRRMRARRPRSQGRSQSPLPAPVLVVSPDRMSSSRILAPRSVLPIA